MFRVLGFRVLGLGFFRSLGVTFLTLIGFQHSPSDKPGRVSWYAAISTIG